MSLKQAGVTLIDCDHSTPPAADFGYPYIAIPQLKNGRIELEGVRRISAEDFALWTKKLKPQVDDVVVVRRCNSGDSAVIPKGLDCAIGQNLVVLRSDGKKIHPRFLRWLIRSPDWWEQVGKYINVGAVFDSLKCKEIPHFELTIPPMSAQKEIAVLLSGLDDRITLLRETNATLEAIAQALFKSWFVDFDPVRAKAAGLEPQAMDATTAALFPDSFEESELGLVPKGWKMSTLGAICDSNGGAIQTGPFGSQLHAADYVVDGVPVVMPKDISNRRVDASTAARVRLEDVQRLARHQLRDGDIVFSRRGDVEKHALIGETERGWLCGTGCLLVRPGTRRNVAGYLSRSLDLPQIKQWLTQHAVGATMPNLNTGILSAVPVVLPADEILAAFEQATNALDKRISAGNAAAQTLTQLRDTLLPRLISGQLRLPEAEMVVQSTLSEAS